MRLFALVLIAVAIAVTGGLMASGSSAKAVDDTPPVITVTEKCGELNVDKKFVKVLGTIVDNESGISAWGITVTFADGTEIVVFAQVFDAPPPPRPTERIIEDEITNGGRLDVTDLVAAHGEAKSIEVNAINGDGKVAKLDPPLATCSVGGTVELMRGAQPSTAADASADGLSAILLGLLIGGSAMTAAAGGWYARRRWMR